MAPIVNVVLAATVACATVVSAAPSTHIGIPMLGNGVGPGRVSVKLARKARHHTVPAVSVLKTYLKFGATPPDHLHAAVARLSRAGHIRRDTGNVSATPIDANDDAYISPVSIGTPPQVLNLDFDTGSSDLWVFSSSTPSDQVDGQTVYNPADSDTAKQVSGASWTITYGDQSSSSGVVYTDVVDIGGLTVKSQAVEAAKQVSDSFTQDSDNDGLVGLAFSSINTVKPKQVTTFFDSAKSDLDAPLFTADLKHGEPGTYNFGYIDKSAYTGQITYVPVDSSQGFWTFTASGYGIGTTTLSSTSITGIADTGTTLLYLPATIVKAYYKKVASASNNKQYGGYVYPCSAKLPDFTFGVGKAKITIPGTYMNYGPASEGSSTCFGGMQDSSGIGINIFGDIALKAAFVVFNGASSPQLGWAAKQL